jgi:hypothetical protein
LFLGTFGQPDPWDVFNPDTFQHPMAPYDVLVDPLSLPSHPVIAQREQVSDVLFDRRKTVVSQDIDAEEVNAWARTYDQVNLECLSSVLVLD